MPTYECKVLASTSIFQRVMLSLQDDAADNEAQSDEKKEPLKKIKCKEMSKFDGIIKVEEESKSEEMKSGKQAIGKRLAEEKQKREEIAYDDEGKGKSKEVTEVGMKTEQMTKNKKKLKAGKIIEVAETAGVAAARQRCKMEENNNPTDGQQLASPSENLSTALSRVHISSTPPRLRGKRGDGQGGFNRGRERRRGKSKHASPEQPKEVPMKNAVMMLNEMFPPPSAAQYKVLSMTGAPNNPTFSLVCCIEGQEFEGSGRSKKEAKLAASQLALTTLFGKVT